MVWTPRVTVAAVIEKNGDFLMVEERQATSSSSVFNQPAGHLESSESLLSAVIRETIEETAYTFTPTALTGIYRWIEPNSGDTYMRVAFTGDAGECDQNLELDDGIVAAHWMSINEVRALGPRLRSPLVVQCIDDYINGCRYPLDLLKEL